MRAAFPSAFSPTPALAIFVAGCAVLTVCAGVAAGAAPAPVAARPFAVVELFTSQGCNSCPRADDALARLTEETGDGERIFAIEWHVDYWDYLGWPDPYATRAATDRQRRYARALPSQLYTPQLVINGATVVRPAQDAGLVRGAAFAALEPGRVGRCGAGAARRRRLA